MFSPSILHAQKVIVFGVPLEEWLEWSPKMLISYKIIFEAWEKNELKHYELEETSKHIIPSYH